MPLSSRWITFQQCLVLLYADIHKHLVIQFANQSIFSDFSDSANDIRLEGTLLTGELPMRDGGYRERQGIELSDRIANENGELVVSLPLL